MFVGSGNEVGQMLVFEAHVFRSILVCRGHEVGQMLVSRTFKKLTCFDLFFFAAGMK